MKHPCPLVPTHPTRHAVRRRATAAVIAIVLPLVASACSSGDSDTSSSTVGAGSVATTPADDSGSTQSIAAVGDPTPEETSGPTETAAAPTNDGDCSMVPTQDTVESIIGSKVLPVEFQEFSGCVYLGDGDNVGIYFEIDTDEFDISSFAEPDPQFAVPVQDPGLPPGSFVQSGDIFAMKNGVLYRITAGIRGTADDDALATQLMVAWMALVP